MDDADTSLCNEKEHLLRAYEFASGDYHRAILVLTQRVGVLKKKEYEQIREFIKVSKSCLEKAREALDLHIADHGC
jgi:hypothetical protein